MTISAGCKGARGSHTPSTDDFEYYKYFTFVNPQNDDLFGGNNPLDDLQVRPRLGYHWWRHQLWEEQLGLCIDRWCHRWRVSLCTWQLSNLDVFYRMQRILESGTRKFWLHCLTGTMTSATICILYEMVVSDACRMVTPPVLPFPSPRDGAGWVSCIVRSVRVWRFIFHYRQHRQPTFRYYSMSRIMWR